MAQNQGILPGTVSPVGETHRSFQITDCSPREQNDDSRTLKIPYSVAQLFVHVGAVRECEGCGGQEAKPRHCRG